MDFKIINRETIYSTRAFEVQKILMQLPNQKQRHYDLVVHTGAVTIVPVDHEGNIWFVTQYRLGAETSLLELPAGTLDPGEDPLDCAAREIREEIGMAAGRLQFLGDFYMAPGYSSEHMYVYLAFDLYPQALEPDSDEFLHISKMPLPEAYRMIRNSELKDGKSLAAMLMAQPFLSVP
ncbi:MAG: ADP-ribose pyrophosphatase [Chloroflexi bacterium HGW-Chloroflexi-10]|nr:MAG: ADP-ribose pyrophosphatase [Chloroflexi bacterium HGW-Chloroflexi-10]